MNISRLESGPLATNAYLVWDNSRVATIIDCPLDSYHRILSEVEDKDLTIVNILNTHGHYDHVANNNMLREKFNVPILVHQADEWRMINPQKDALALMFSPLPTKPDKHISEGDMIKVGSLEFQVIETPGHSKGSVSFFEKESKSLFSGDVLFQNSIGRYDFSDSDYEELMKSIKNLLTLGDSVTIYPGHGEKTTIEYERKKNPFLQSL